MICQWCKQYCDPAWVYAGKYYHLYCFKKLEAMAAACDKRLDGKEH